MAIKTFVSVDYSTIWDVVNNTYGGIDDVVKIMVDNDFKNINTYPSNGQNFLFDDTIVENQNNLQTNAPGRKFATRDRTTTNEENMKYYEQDIGTQFTSNADGTTSISLIELQGALRIVQCEKEIKPLGSSEFGFNSTSGTINLLGGAVLDNGQTLYIIYAKLITS